MPYRVSVEQFSPESENWETTYMQTVEELDLQAVIDAVNKKPARKHRKKETPPNKGE